MEILSFTHPQERNYFLSSDDQRKFFFLILFLSMGPPKFHSATPVDESMSSEGKLTRLGQLARNDGL